MTSVTAVNVETTVTVAETNQIINVVTSAATIINTAVTTMAGLLDTEFTALNDGDFVVWEDSTGKFINLSISDLGLSLDSEVLMLDGSTTMIGEFKTDIGTLLSNVASGGNAFIFDTGNLFSLGNLISLKNKTTEKYSVDKDGYIDQSFLAGDIKHSVGGGKSYLFTDAVNGADIGFRPYGGNIYSNGSLFGAFRFFMDGVNILNISAGTITP